MIKKIYLLCGIPGSGKSTWAKKQIESNSNASWISRDIVRFSMVNENEEYFSKESIVFLEFVKRINEAIKIYDFIYIDATHINISSRNKILKKLNLKDCEVIPVNFIVSLETAIKRNNKRTGRAFIPTKVIEKMYDHFIPASLQENPIYAEIWNIKEE